MFTDKSNALCVLKILEEYSDENHILKRSKLDELLKEKYGLKLDRRTIYSAINTLSSIGYDISDFAENNYGYYLRDREFDPSEIRLLMDAICSIDYISKRQTDALIEKFQKRLSIYQRNSYKNLSIVRVQRKINTEEIFLNISLLDEAITHKKKIKFDYYEYKADKKLHKRSYKPIIASPYGMVCENKHYYVVIIRDGYDRPALYRIDLMNNIVEMKSGIEKPAERANLEMVNSVTYAYAGKPKMVKMLCDQSVIRHVIDEFGTRVKIEDQGNNKCLISFKTSPEGLKYWAMQYLQTVEILEPVELRTEIISQINSNVYCSK